MQRECCEVQTLVEVSAHTTWPLQLELLQELLDLHTKVTDLTCGDLQIGQSSQLYVTFNSQDHTGTGPQHWQM